MNIEEMVRTSMDRLARGVEPTLPDPSAVRARANRSRRVRSFAIGGLAVAAAAALVMSFIGLRDRSSGFGPTHPPNSVGRRVDVNAVWMINGVLHIGDQAYPQDNEIDTALVPVASGAVYGARGGKIVYQPADGPAQIVKTDGEANPPNGPTPLGPAAAADSDVVAILRWSTDDDRYDLYLYDAARGRQIGTGLPVGDDSMDLPGAPNPFGDSPLAPIYWVGPNDDSGFTTLIRDHQQLWRYDAKGNGAGRLQQLGPAPIDATLNVITDADADGLLTFTTFDGKTLSSVDNVELDGGLSYDGAYYAALSADPHHREAIAVVDTHTGDTRYINPPAGTEATFPSWSNRHTLMFRATAGESHPAGFVVACNANTLGCANVAEVDDVDQTVLPRL